MSREGRSSSFAGAVRGEGHLCLGIDPGTAVTGFGVVRVDDRRRTELVECGVVRTSPRAALAFRLLEIHDAVTAWVAEFSPAVVAVEDVFQGRNVRSALTLGHARGVILLAAAMGGVEVAEYTPAQIKSTVAGRGAASKVQLAYMVQKHLRLESPPTPSDAADGVAAALCHSLRTPQVGHPSRRVPAMTPGAADAQTGSVTGSGILPGASRP